MARIISEMTEISGVTDSTLFEAQVETPDSGGSLGRRVPGSKLKSYAAGAVQEGLEAEQAARAAAVSSLQESIEAEQVAREADVSGLQSALDAETQARQSADAAETERATGAESLLSQAVAAGPSGTDVQRVLALFQYTPEDALVRAQGDVDVSEGGALEIDGVQTGAGDIVLLTEQDDATENGLWMVQTGPWARAAGYTEEDGQAFDSRYIDVRSGETDAGKIYAVTTKVYAIGETGLDFAETAFSSAGIPGKIIIRDRGGSFGGSGTIPVLAAIYIHTMPAKTAYEEGEDFDAEGLSVRGVYSDGSLEELYPGDGVSGYTLTEPDMAAEGTKTVTAAYRGFTADFQITVSEAPPPPALTFVTVYTKPDKLSYETGEDFAPAGIVVWAVYSDGSHTVLSYDESAEEGYSLSSPDTATAGTKTVTVTYNPEGTPYTDTFNIEVTPPSDYDGVVDNTTETNNSLLLALGAATVAEAWSILHTRINADGLANYHGLGLGDYLDITAGLPSPASIAWSAAAINLRIYIVGFNTFKGVNYNTKNHIVWGFKNCVATRSYNSSNTNTGGYPASALKTYVDGTLLPSLVSALGADYLYDVARSVSTKGGMTAMSAKLWIPNEMEVFGSKSSGDDPEPQQTIPLYAKGASYRVKNSGGSAATWWEGSPDSSGTTNFCRVGSSGTASASYASTTYGVSPCFCEI
jgi:hypothetical protein